ncbi:MAG: ParA family protein [Holosporales bacterium]|jgi:chromosome partitioning protein|nr:ParA family protein [Holosporales bacterium]
MVQVVAVSNQKGGVGKTTTAINLSASLAAAGYRILLIDLDPQRNASVGLSSPIAQENVYTFLSGINDFSSSVHDTFVPNLRLMPSTINLSAIELELTSQKDREYVLKSRMHDMLDDYDFVFIDCPPSFGLLSLNAWNASSFVLIPLQCEYYALEGLVLLLNNILKIKKTFNKKLLISGVVLTMYEKRNVLSREIEIDVRKNLGEKVYKTVIPRNVKIAESPSHGKPVLFYDFKSPGTIAYLELAREFLKKHQIMEDNNEHI